MIRLISLYPRAWRDRYELEFQALMSERPPTPRDRLDIVRGALDARLHPQLRQASPDSTPRLVRIGATLAVLGGGVWVAAGLAFLGSSMIPDLGYKDSSSAVVIAIAGALVTGIAAFMVARSMPGRSAAATNAATAIVFGALAMTQPWPVVFFGYYAAIIGTLLFGLIVLPRIGMTGIALAVAALLASAFNTEDERALLLVPLGAAWILFGLVLSVRGVPATVNLDWLKAALRPPRTAI
jgi:hypothetical protein